VYMCIVLLPPGVNPIAGNKYIILYQMNTRNISWGVKLAHPKSCQFYHLHVPIALKSLKPQPPENFWNRHVQEMLDLDI